MIPDDSSDYNSDPGKPQEEQLYSTELEMQQQLNPVTQQLAPTQKFSQELESRLRLFTNNPQNSPDKTLFSGKIRNLFSNKRWSMAAIALVLVMLAGSVYFTAGSTPLTQEAFCANSNLTPEQIATYQKLSTNELQLLENMRGLTPQEVCGLSAEKLAKAMERLNPNEASEPSADGPAEYAQWEFDRQRDAKGQVPADGLLRAKKHIASMPLVRPGGIMPNVAGTSPASWNWVGPGNIGGRIRALVIDKNNSQIIYIGAVAGGIWKTTDAGATWTLLNDFLPNMSVVSLVMDPTNSNTLYAGTGEGFFNADGIRGNGVFKTTDAGATWTQIPSTNTADFYYVNRLAISSDGTSLLAATRTGLHRSTDSGASWTKVYTVSVNASASLHDVNFDPTNNLKAVAGGNYGTALYSTDGGATWLAATGNWEATTFYNRIEVAYAPSSPNIVYVSVGSQTAANNGVWRSTDGGATYTRVSSTSTNALGNQGWYDNIINVAPTDPNLVFWAGLDIYRSTDGGTTFTKVSQWQAGPPIGNQSAHADHHNIVFPPNYDGTTVKRAYFTNDGGIFKTEDVTTVAQLTGWVNLNHNLGITQFYGGAGNAQSGVIVAGAQDNGTLRYSGNSQAWTPMFGGDGGYAAANQNDPNYFYGEYVYLTMHRSSNAGVSSSSIYSGISDASTTTPNANFIAPFLLDPNDQSKLIGGGNSLWRTNDAKAGTVAWNQITVPTVGTNCLNTSPRSCISAIAIAKGNSDIMWFGRSNGYVYYTANGTSNTPTWTRVDANMPGGTPARAVNWITIDPQNSGTVYVALGGFSANNLLKTTDGGTTWTAVVGSGPGTLPQVPLYTVAVAPYSSSWLYVGTTSGLFASENGGASWQVAPNDGPSNAPVNELSWMGNTLLSVTHGRGVFTAYITPSVPLLSIASKVITDGNDGIYLPGESISVTIGLHNDGGAAATVSTHNLVVISGSATIVSASSTYATINPGTTVTNTPAYVVSINANAPCGSVITLRQTVGYDGGRTLNTDFNLVVGQLVLGSSAVYSYTGPAVFIPDSPAPGVSATLTTNVPATQYVGKINNVKITSVTHTYIGDVTFVLVAPSGKSVTLVAQRGGDTSGSGIGITNLVLSDSAANPISSTPGNGTISGSYRPEQPLSTLIGEPLNGAWSLYMADGGAGDTGTLVANGWSMDVQSASYQCSVPSNPVPQLTSLTPNSASAGSAPISVTLVGSNFITSSVANFAATPRVTTFVSSTQLLMQLTAGDLTTAGVVTVTVTNPAPGGGTSNSLNFTVTLVCNPLIVSAITDNGLGDTCGTFSAALAAATNGNSITFALSSGNAITLTGALTKDVPANITIDGGSGSGIILNGNGVAGDGLRLKGNDTLRNLTVQRFSGHEVVSSVGGLITGGNLLDRVHVAS